VLGCWLRIVGHGDTRRIRPATGRRGEHLIPTAKEERDKLAVERDAALERAARAEAALERLKKKRRR